MVSCCGSSAETANEKQIFARLWQKEIPPDLLWPIILYFFQNVNGYIVKFRKFCYHKVTSMRPEADAPPPMKVLRAHLAYLNSCRLIGGGTFILNICSVKIGKGAAAYRRGIPVFRKIVHVPATGKGEPM